MRGRKPVPTELHKLRGTFNATRHRARRAGEPTAAGSLSAEAPEWMSPGQKAAWRYALERAPAGILRAIDYGVFAVWVVAEDEFRAATVAQAQLDADKEMPLIVKDKNGEPIASPYLGIRHRAALRMCKAASELGFSPAARPRLRIAPDAGDAGDSPWAKFAVVDGGKA